MAGARHRRPLARAVVFAALAAGVGLSAAACAGEWSGRVGAELRLFTQSPADPRQEGPSNLSLVAEPEYYTAWNGKRDGFTFVPILRLDQHDGGRTHADIRELTFPGSEGRLRPLVPVDTAQTQYADDAKERHIDAALRWHRVIDEWDIGLSHFSGTSRDPRLLPGVNRTGELVLIPRYDLIDQTGLDVQWTHEAWLWKLEAIRRSGQGPTYTAATGGFEYTVANAFASTMDVGLVAEYLYDERGLRSLNPFQDDLMLGLRLGANDAQSTDALLAVIVDRQTRAAFYSLEANRRVGTRWKLAQNTHTNTRTGADDPLASYRNDDYIQTELSLYF